METLEQKIEIKVTGDEKVQLTLDYSSFYQLKDMVESMGVLSNARIDEKQDDMQWAFKAKILERPDMADKLLESMNFFNKCIIVLAENGRFNDDFWQILESKAKEID